MAQVTRIRRLANPSRRRTKRSNPRKLSLAQKLHFGTKRQRTAAKAALSRRRKPKAKATSTSTSRRRRVARRNPAVVVTLGALNPQKRRKTSMADTRRRRTRRASNPRRRRVAVAAPRRRRRAVRAANPAHRRRRSTSTGTRRRRRAVNPIRRRRRNPAAMGHRAFSADMVKMVGGGLLGVALTKFVANMIPAGLRATMGTLAPTVSNGIAALAVGIAAQKFIGGPVGDGVMFGGLMQTGSAAINTLIPGLAIGGTPIALSGMGDLVSGAFVVPQNPLRPPYLNPALIPAPAVPTTARTTVNGLDRAYGRAF